MILAGMHIAEPEKQLFSDWWIEYTGFEEWLSEHPFETQFKTDSDERLSICTMNFVTPSPIVCNIPAIKASIEIIHGMSSSSESVHTRKYRHIAGISVKPEAPMSRIWFDDVRSQFGDLLLFCIGEAIYPRKIIAFVSPRVTDEHRDGIAIYFHFPHRKPDRETELCRFNMLLPLYTVRHMIGDILKTWYDKQKKLKHVYDLYFGSLRNDSLYTESAFLLLTQAIESYSRSCGKSTYLSEQAYKKVNDALVSAIPSDTDSDLKMSLRNRIKYGNEHSLRKRVAALMAALEEETQRIICKDTKEFRNRIVDSRNYLTHYSDDIPGNLLKGRELYIANLRLQALLIILISKEIGICESDIRRRLSEDHPKWMQLILLHMKGSS